ncbi:MAG TPA: biotin/lipoyl-binding protein [Candidatus Limadaptatus stercoravium]|nr:biotin/lipoyl-binding protein [Candidatus Limadaptatus stercoravium]
MIYKVTLNGKVYEVEVEKGEAVIQAEYEAALPAAPAAAPAAPVSAAPAPAAAASAAAPAAQAGAGTVPSPLPGNINEVRFSAGQTVKAGDVVIILEAMKMENEIVAPKAGTLTKIHVQKGAVVNTGDPLFDVE